MKNEFATLGGGCFWCLDALYQDLKGVIKVESGFAGGHVNNPNYREVVNGTTGHAEVVHIEFNPIEVSFEDLLNIFFVMHDPTTLNRQGNDVGPQYRSIVLCHDENQKKLAEKVIGELAQKKVWKKPIVTEIKDFDKFYIADEYHQDYFNRNRNQGYCQFVIEPKVAKFRKLYYDKLKK